ncbi:hypothetical protein GCM10020331_098280 [Ectobacillus funiculus]
MDNTNPEYVDFNIICSDDCGNAPKIFLKEFTVAFANNDMVFITENITDSFHQIFFRAGYPDYKECEGRSLMSKSGRNARFFA